MSYRLGKRVCLGLAVATVCVVARPTVALEAGTLESYAITGSIAGAGGQWDQAIVDQETDQFLLAHSGVTVLDLRNDQLRTGLVRGAITHDVAALPGGLAAMDDAASREIEIFRPTTGKVVSTIPTGPVNRGGGIHALDTLIWDSWSSQLIAINGDTGRVLFVDYLRRRLAGFVRLGAPAEGAVADGRGNVFVNVNRRRGAQVAVIDIRRHRVMREIPLAGCPEATGIAFDGKDDLIVDVCTRGLLEFIQARTGARVASVRVGTGADAVMFDSARRRAFVAGADGTLSVLAVDGPKDIHVVQVLKTPPGTRLGAVDIRTGRLYLPCARFGPPVPPNPYPSVVPGSFKILVVAPLHEHAATPGPLGHSS